MNKANEGKGHEAETIQEELLEWSWPAAEGPPAHNPQIKKERQFNSIQLKAGPLCRL